MQANVSSAGTADSYALLFLVKHQAENGGLVRHFVCSECMGMVEAVQGQGYLHSCEVATTPTAVRFPLGPRIDANLAALV